MRVLIVGCGYVGLPLGMELVRQGHEVFGLRRSAAAETELKRGGITPLLADITQPESLKKLPRDFDWVVNCTASGGGDADDYRKIYLEGNRNLVAWLTDRSHLDADSGPLSPSDGERVGERGFERSTVMPPLPAPLLHPMEAREKTNAERGCALAETTLKKFIYTSSTSVYGQNDGSVVTEKSPAEPDAPTAKVLVEAENFLLAKDGSRGRSPHQNFPAIILRVAGIYGPARGHSFKQFLRGEAHIEGDGARFLNMIHRDDVIGVIIAALKNGTPGEIYNAADNEPVSQRNFFEWLTAELQKPLPPRVAADAEVWRKRGMTNKRISNAKLRAELKYEFQFPDFRAGYAAELAQIKSAELNR